MIVAAGGTGWFDAVIAVALAASLGVILVAVTWERGAVTRSALSRTEPGTRLASLAAWTYRNRRVALAGWGVG